MSFTPAEMPRGTALLPTDLGVGWIDRQTDKLFGYWSMAIRNANEISVIKIQM